MHHKRKTIKFDSFSGFALSEAKKKGDLVSIAFQFNVNDGFPSEGKLIMTQNILDGIVYPEIIRRAQNNSLESDFRLQHAHLLLYSDPSKNDILLNNDVRLKLHVKFVDDKKFNEGQQVMKKDIEEIIGVYPNSNNDPNAAHIMLTKFNGKWYYAANLIYDRVKNQRRFNTSQKYLKIVKTSLEDENWSPFVDNLFSVTELAIQTILLLRHYAGYSLKQSHEATSKLFKAYCETGNTPMEFFRNYEELWKLRKKARYLQGTHGKEFSIKIDKAKQMFSVTEKITSYTNNLLKTIDFHARPKDGHYITIGKI